MWQRVCLCAHELTRLHSYVHTWYGEEHSWEFFTLFSHHVVVTSQWGRLALYVQTGDSVVNRSPGGICRRNAATISEGLCFFSLPSCSVADETRSALVRLINYDKNNKDEKCIFDCETSNFIPQKSHQNGRRWVPAETCGAWPDMLFGKSQLDSDNPKYILDYILEYM